MCYTGVFRIPVLTMFIERSLMEKSALNHHIVFCVLFCNLYFYSYYNYFFYKADFSRSGKPGNLTVHQLSMNERTFCIDCYRVTHR